MSSSGETSSIITDAMRAWVGAQSLPLTSPLISESDIRRAAIAMYWPEVPPRIFWDVGHARRTSWGGIIAPSEFNPFAWMVGRAHVGPAPIPLDAEQAHVEESRNLRPPGAPTRFLFGGIRSDYDNVMRPGDVITSVIHSTDVYERTGRSGPMVFYITEERWINQVGGTVKATHSTNILW
ncbi:MAG: MaoC family dehydratase N-terminal domain-containing protein [Chloroflexi bacterium]|nr:MaoC family dehydratase N-terminal domain-containing protein [Chloroflexota bacterium]